VARTTSLPPIAGRARDRAQRATQPPVGLWLVVALLALVVGCAPSQGPRTARGPGCEKPRPDPVALATRAAEGRVAVLVDYLERRPERRYGALADLAEMAEPAYARELLQRLGGKPSDEPMLHQRILALLDERAVEQVRRWAREGAPAVRRQAVLSLGRLAGTECIGDLIERLGDSDPLVVASAEDALARLGRDALAALMGVLDGDQPLLVKAAAARVVARIGDGEAAAVLVPLYRQVARRADRPREGERMAFLVALTETLGRLPEPNVVLALVEGLSSADARLRECAAHSLAEVLASLDSAEREQHREIINATRAAAVRALGDPNRRVRREAARAAETAGYAPASQQERIALLIARQDWGGLLALKAPGPVAAALVECLRKEQVAATETGLARQFYLTVAGVLAELGEGAIGPLGALLLDRGASPLARETAALALGEIGGPQAERPLITALGDPEARIRLEAARGLGKIATPRCIEAIVGFLTSDVADYDGTCGALAAAGHRGLNTLLRLLDEPDNHIREVATHALARLGKLAKWRLLNHTGRPPRGAGNALAAILEVEKQREYRRDRRERWKTKCGMDPLEAASGADGGFATVVARAECLRAAGRRRDVRFLAALPLIVANRAERVHIRRTAALALADLGAASLGAVPALKSISENPAEDPRVRDAARMALERIGLKAGALPFDDRVWLTCRLAAVLDDPLEYPHVRASAARALVCLGQAAALAAPALEKAAVASGDPDLTAAAGAALKQLRLTPTPLTRSQRARAARALGIILESELTYPHPMARAAAEMLASLGSDAGKALTLLERASHLSAGTRQYERRRLRAVAARAADQVRRASGTAPTNPSVSRSGAAIEER